MSRLPIIYQDKRITVTDSFIRVASMQDRVILLDQVNHAWVHRYRGNHKKGAPMFFVIGIVFLFIVPPIGVWLLLMAAGSWFAPRYEYSLILAIGRTDRILYDSMKARGIRRAAKAINKEVRKRPVILPEQHPSVEH